MNQLRFCDHPAVRLTVWLGLLVGTTLLTGCSGCNRDAGENAAAANQQETPFQFGDVRFQPSDATLAGLRPVKPGHYVEGQWRAKANLMDVQAELKLSAVDNNGQPILARNSRFRESITRSAPLPKGQEKSFETIYFIPRRAGTERVWVQQSLIASRGGAELDTKRNPTTAMPGFQYFLVVLSNQPDQYTFLKQMEAVRQPSADVLNEASVVYYRVVLPDVNVQVPLPSTPLCWTSIACLVWDDMNPLQLTPVQQQSLVDWLHWGGQLIISGPRAVDQFKGSFLEPYLPATSTGGKGLTADDLAVFNENWAQVREKGGERLELTIAPGAPLRGVELNLHNDARFVPGTGSLVAERRIGRGRIVMTAFPLHDRDLLTWKSYDNFFNAALLRRPSRLFSITEELIPRYQWAGAINLEDARVVSNLRYFARDVGQYGGRVDAGVEPATSEYWQLDGYVTSKDSGVAGWNDNSGPSHEARRALQSAAGITIPKPTFVWQTLSVYLLVLVPVNWLVFRSMGRVEWAWLATPLIAIVGAAAVMHFAQLDIGFARSRTELAVLEFHADYARGHLSRYTALYSSLSTPFDLKYAGETALARPFPGTGNTTSSRVYDVQTERGTDVTLSGFQVESNSTGIVHSEQIVDLQGTIYLEGDGSQSFLVNQSAIELKGVGVVRRTMEGRLEGAWAGRLSPNGRKDLAFQAIDDAIWFEQWNANPHTASSQDADSGGDLKIDKLLKLAVQQLELRPGAARLVGWMDEPVGGLEFSPGISQTLSFTMVVGHLRFGPLPLPESDVNSLIDVRDKQQAGALDLDGPIPGVVIPK